MQYEQLHVYIYYMYNIFSHTITKRVVSGERRADYLILFLFFSFRLLLINYTIFNFFVLFFCHYTTYQGRNKRPITQTNVVSL